MMKYVAILAGLLCSLSVSATSFDCNKARTYVEKTICQNDQLSQLDEDMAAYYRTKIAYAKTVGSWELEHQKAIQTEWLIYERNTCRTRQCITNAYETRLGRKPSDVIKPDKPPTRAFGVFEEQVQIPVYQGKATGWKKETASQLLRIDSGNNSLSAVVNADLVFTNAHMCSLHNESVRWYGNHFRLIHKDDDLSCELRFYPTKSGIYLKDINHECRKRYCGARGSFDRFVIERQRKR